MFSCKHPFSWLIRLLACVCFCWVRRRMRAERPAVEDKLQFDAQLLSNQSCKCTSRAHWISLPSTACVCVCVFVCTPWYVAGACTWRCRVLKAVCRAELSRAGPSQGGPQVWLCCEDAGREGGRLWGRGGGGGGLEGVGVVRDGWRGTSLTRYLRLDAGLVVGAEQLGLDGLNNTLETSAGTWWGTNGASSGVLQVTESCLQVKVM